MRIILHIATEYQPWTRNPLNPPLAELALAAARHLVNSPSAFTYCWLYFRNWARKNRFFRKTMHVQGLFWADSVLLLDWKVDKMC